MLPKIKKQEKDAITYIYNLYMLLKDGYPLDNLYINLDEKDCFDKTILDYAMEDKNVEICKQLLEKKID